MNWSIELVLKGTILLLAAWTLANERNRLSASVRDVIWTVAFAALLLLPLLTWITPSWSGPISVSITADSAQGGALPAASFDWMRWIWIAGLCVSLGSLATAHIRAALLAASSRRLQDESGVRLCEISAGTMPMTWGVFRPVVLLPSDATHWDGEVRSSVIRHELAHVRRNDLWKQLFTQFACCLWWFHPLAWMAARHAAKAREEACDNEVLSQGTAGTTYAEHLIEVARGRITVAAASGMPFGSQLEGRILAVLDDRARRETMKRNAITAACLLAALLMLPFAGMEVLAEKVYKGTDEGIVKPVAIKKVPPPYPEDAKKAGVQGIVKLSLEVSVVGIPENIVVKESVHPDLDTLAVAAVQQWEFEPGTKDGKPVRVDAQVDINYRLE
jgi:TonB family protein